MSDLICRKSMMRCQTSGMCSPHGGCQASVLIDSDVRYATDSDGGLVWLLAELKRHQDLYQHMKSMRECYGYESWTEVLTVAEKLKAENEDGLAVIRTQKQQLDCYIKDAERYRLLRGKKFRPGCLSSDPEKAKYLDEYMVCGDRMDDVIDAQLAKVK